VSLGSQTNSPKLCYFMLVLEMLTSLLLIYDTVNVTGSGNNVWAQVALVADKVSPNYQRVEELFCQKVVDKSAAAPADQKVKKKSEEVNTFIIYKCTLYICVLVV